MGGLATYVASSPTCSETVLSPSQISSKQRKPTSPRLRQLQQERRETRGPVLTEKRKEETERRRKEERRISAPRWKMVDRWQLES